MDRPTDPSDASPGQPSVDASAAPFPAPTPSETPAAAGSSPTPDAPASPVAVLEPPRPTLTRVPVDPTLIVDEQATDWCRHEVRRIVAWQLLATGLVTFAALVPVVWWQLGDPVLAVLLAVLGAGAVSAARFGLALAAAPLGYRYVQRYTSSPPEFLLAHQSAIEAGILPGGTPGTPGTAGEPVDLWDLDPEAADGGRLDQRFAAEIGDAMAAHRHHERDGHQPLLSGADPATAPTAELAVTAGPGPLVDIDGTPVPERHAASAEVLREMGFSPVTTLRIDGPGGRYTDLYSDGDRVVAAVDRTSGTTTMLTELVGFRVLVTSALLVPPTDELVVNVVEDADTAGLVLSHQRLVKQAVRSRTLVSEPVGLFKLAQQRELEAYRELGPLWGAVLDLRCRPRGVRLLAAPSAGDVLLFTGNRLFRQTAREAAS